MVESEEGTDGGSAKSETRRANMTIGRILPCSLLAATLLLAALSRWGVPAEGKDAVVAGIPPHAVADYLHDVIQADRTIYTTHIVERMQVRGVVVASENWEARGTLPLPVQFLM